MVGRYEPSNHQVDRYTRTLTIGTGQALTVGLPVPAPHFAAVSFGAVSEGWAQILTASLYSNGSVIANWWDSTHWHVDFPPTINGGSTTNFSAVAMNGDLRFYGLSAGQILEYTISAGNPFAWTYVNPVNTTTTT